MRKNRTKKKKVRRRLSRENVLLRRELDDIRSKYRQLSSESSKSSSIDLTDDEQPTKRKRPKIKCSKCDSSVNDIGRHLKTKKHFDLSDDERSAILEDANKQRPVRRQRTESESGGSSSSSRTKVKCELCHKTGFNINRHLKSSYHKFTQEQVEDYRTKYNLWNSKRRKELDRPCLHPECKGRTYARLDKHLIRKHGHKSRSSEHLEYLQSASRKRNRKLSATTTTTDEEEENLIDEKEIETISNNNEIDSNLFNYVAKFAIWAETRSGAKKSQGTAKNYYAHANMMLRILATALNNKGDVLKESQLTDENLENYFIDHLDNMKKRDGTNFAATYRKGIINSIKNFILYLKKQVQRKALKTLTYDELDIIESSSQNWIRSFGKEIKAHRFKVIKRKTEDQLVKEDFIKFRDCAAMVKVRQDLLNFDEKSKLNVTIFNNYMGYLIIELMVSNFQRIGTTYGLTVPEFLSAKLIVTNKDNVELKHWVMQVYRHKTTLTYGSAAMIMTERLYNLMNNFYRFVRPRAPGFKKIKSDDDQIPFLFIYDKGKSLDDNAGRIASKVWKICVPEKKFNSSLLRTYVHTKIARNNPVLMGVLARQMSHGELTGKTYYRNHFTDKETVENQNEMRDVADLGDIPLDGELSKIMNTNIIQIAIDRDKELQLQNETSDDDDDPDNDDKLLEKYFTINKYITPPTIAHVNHVRNLPGNSRLKNIELSAQEIVDSLTERMKKKPFKGKAPTKFSPKEVDLIKRKLIRGNEAIVNSSRDVVNMLKIDGELEPLLKFRPKNIFETTIKLVDQNSKKIPADNSDVSSDASLSSLSSDGEKSTDVGTESSELGSEKGTEDEMELSEKGTDESSEKGTDESSEKGTEDDTDEISNEEIKKIFKIDEYLIPPSELHVKHLLSKPNARNSPLRNLDHRKIAERIEDLMNNSKRKIEGNFAYTEKENDLIRKYLLKRDEGQSILDVINNNVELEPLLKFSMKTLKIKTGNMNRKKRR